MRRGTRFGAAAVAATAVAAFGGIGAAGAAADNTCPTSWTLFHVNAYSAASATAEFGFGDVQYLTPAQAPSHEAFVWSNIVDKDGYEDFLHFIDRDHDGLTCYKLDSAANGPKHKLPPEVLEAFDPLYGFWSREDGSMNKVKA